jgi:hypothetical protein
MLPQCGRAARLSELSDGSASDSFVNIRLGAGNWLVEAGLAIGVA